MQKILRLPLAAAITLSAACGSDEPDEAMRAAQEQPMQELAGEPQDLIELPADFAPEGIAVDGDYTFYVGSLSGETMGQILSGDLRTGEFSELVAPTGEPVLGIKHDDRTNTIFVAGGASGRGKVYDAETGAEVASYTFAAGGAMINDVELTSNAAYFTNSQGGTLYRVEIGPDGAPGAMSTIELPEVFGTPGNCEGAPPIMGNGAAATEDGRYLILIHMSDGDLYRMDTESGEVTQIALSGGDACSADGLLLDGNRLYAVQNRMNQIAVIDLTSDYSEGSIAGHITEPFASNPATKVPTTIAQLGTSLFAVTAGFADPSPDYVVRVDKM